MLITLFLNIKQEETWFIPQKKIKYKVNIHVNIHVNIYILNQLESIFIKISRPDLPGGTIGLTYKHLSMNFSTFNTEFFGTPLKNLSKENTEFILMGDFNVNLINFGKKEITHQLLKKLCRNDYTLKLLFQQEQLYSSTFTDSIFMRTKIHKQSSGSVTTSICDHLSKFYVL